MERTPPQVQTLATTVDANFSATENFNKCIICGDCILVEQDVVTLSECNHSFHRNCIDNHLCTSPECPSCKRQCSLAEIRKVKNLCSNRGRPRGAMSKTYKTRSQVRNLFQGRFPNTSVDLEPGREDVTEVGILDTPTNSPLPNKSHDNSRQKANAPQSQIDYDQIGFIVENAVTRMLENLNLGPMFIERGNSPSRNSNSNRNSRPTFLDQNNSQNPNQRSSHYNTNANQTASNNYTLVDHPNINNRNSAATTDNFNIRPEKVTAIIKDWNIRFDGSHNGVNVDEFLYRVRTLTKENLNNDFSVLCKNLPLLLSGKAQDWYWRYHKQVPQIDWSPFCAALKYQYKEFRSSYDIKEEIRSRKMKPTETFEAFYDSILSMLDRLDQPMEEQEVIEILTRNLRPEIRHELLYVPIFSLAHLRKLVQMRESLLSEDQFRRGMSAKIIPNQGIRKIADIDFDGCNDSFTEDKVQLVDAVQQPPRPVKCWNCNEFGHCWEDCEAERNIFCYGCGEKNTYKPQCAKCSSRKLWKSKN